MLNLRRRRRKSSFLGSGPVRTAPPAGPVSAGCNDDDMVNPIIEKARGDGFVFGTPVYYAHPPAASFRAGPVFYAGKTPSPTSEQRFLPGRRASRPPADVLDNISPSPRCR